MTPSNLSIGVDLGATWLRVVGVSEGRTRVRARIPAVHFSELPAVLRRLLRTRGLRPARLCVGSTGIWRTSDRRWLARRLAPLAGAVRVLSDLELAWLAALGGEPGLLLLSGTGSAVYGRDVRGRAARGGGLGALLGDDGSGFWIGREWLRTRPEPEALAYARRPRPVPTIAALAGKVLRRAGRDPVAARIVGEAQEALASQARAVAGRLRFDGLIPWSWHGGVLEDASFRAGVRRRLGPRWVAVPPRLAPELAAALLGH